MKVNSITQVLEFARHPDFSAVGETRQITLWKTMGWISSMFALSMLAYAFGALTLHIIGRNLPPDKFIGLLSSHPTFKIVAVVLLAPFIEELSFRAFLSKSTFWIITGLTFFIFFCVNILLSVFVVHSQSNSHFLSNFPTSFFEKLPRLFVIVGVLYIFKERVVNFFHKHNRLILWASCAVFGVAHVWNFEIGFHFWLALLVLPQFISGFILAYVRNRHGLGSSILVHLLFDSVIAVLMWATNASKVVGGSIQALVSTGAFMVFLFMFAYGFYFLFKKHRLNYLTPAI